MKTPTTPPRLLRISEVAELIGSSERHVERHILRGGLKVTKIGSLTRIHPQDFVAWIRKCRTARPAAARWVGDANAELTKLD